MPALRFSTAFKVVRGIRAFLDLKCGLTRAETPAEHQDAQARKLEDAARKLREQRRRLAEKDRRIENLQGQRKALRREVRWAVSESEAGVLPDYLIVGAQKSGTTYLYHLLCEHPYVAPAAEKEVHYFDSPRFRRGTDWYRSNFPQPSRKDGRRVITGESSPYYLYHPRAAQRAAKIVPRAKLIALLRNPVDRAYSDYRDRFRMDHETLSFEAAIDAEEERIAGEKEKLLANESRRSLSHRRYSYLARGIYVDQLEEWHRYFGEDQLLILGSEDFFARPQKTLDLVAQFLGLPSWGVDLDAETNTGGYKDPLSSEMRRRLETYFEPHNQRLYDYLGRDFGW